jgi:nicotinate-nucleotide pyrophosphorylase (carboxylating)
VTGPHGPLEPPDLEALVERALAEDIRSGDVTSRALVPEGLSGRAALVAREGLVVAGLAVAARCFGRLDAGVSWQAHAKDGDAVEAGSVVARVAGDLRALLTAERTALNFLQRAAGIATATRELVEAVAGTGVAILDTRKTAPGLRLLDKAAVRAGGGASHRFALDDMILVKDNHLRAAGTVGEAVRRALAAAGHSLKVEVEVDSLAQLDALLAQSRLPHAVLLDNFTPDAVREAVVRVAGRLHVEVSGGVTRTTLRAYAEAGPDAISVGALTHSVKAADLALDLEEP